MQLLDKVRDSYNVNLLSQAAGLAAITDTVYYDNLIAKVIRTRNSFTSDLEKKGWFSYASQANFIFTQPVNAAGEKGQEVAKSMFDFLLGKKILVRYFGNDSRTDSFLRISVGSDPEMLTLSEAIDQWLNNA